MKVTIERTAFFKALAHVQRVVEKRNTIAILGNVLIRATEEGLVLRATDLDLEVTETVAAQVDQPGSTTVPAILLHDIVRKLPDGGQVSLTKSGETDAVVVRCGKSRFTLAALPETDFPNLAAGELPNAFTLPKGELKKLITKTQFAISTEEMRYYLNGIYLHTTVQDGRELLRSVATDGHRLARCETPLPQGAAGMSSVIVPRKAVAEILKLLDDADSEVTIELSPTKIRLTFGAVVLTSKLIDGTFPDYQRVIPVANDKVLLVDKPEFQTAVDRVATISSEKSRAVKVSLDERRLTLTVTTPEAGTATEELEVEYESTPLDIGFNAKYLLDIFAQIDGDTAIFKLSDPGSPAVIVEKEGSASLFVLMPLRV